MRSMFRRRGRRLIPAAIAVALAVVVSSCGSGPTTEDFMSQVKDGSVDELGLLEGKPYDGTTIRFLTCCASSPQFASLKARTAEFTERTGITVESSNVPYATFLQKIVAESAIGGGTYDMLIWPDAWGPSLKVGVQPLDEVMAKDGITLDDFSGPFREAAAAGTDGQTMGLPLRGFSYNLFYRKDIYDQLGLEAPKTWDEYYQQLALIKSKTDKYPLAGQFSRNSGQNLYTWLTMLWSNGAELFDGDGNPTFTSPEAVATTEKYIESVRQGYTPPASTNWGETDATTAFLKGNAATVMTWSWHLDDFTNTGKAAPELDGNVGVAALPAFAGKTPSSYAYTWLTGVLNTSKNQGAAWEYVKWMTSASTERAVALDKDNPATTTGITVHNSNMLDPEVNAANKDLPEIQYEVLQSARAIPMNLDWPRIMDILAVAVNEMANGADVQSTLESAADEIKKLD
ncbi:ABC transporter substrate-binding protein [Rhodococcus sp. NPDC056516]|uniref:ABC transporter substrate-binding protein n=1 Tax=Rhodococcus sp. NPDC056516 TaxID=3345847 RepID=UPI0036716C72